MALLVRVQNTTLRERFAAYLAKVGPFSGVDSLVVPQIPVTIKPHWAVPTGKGLLVRVPLDVGCHAFTAIKLPAAYVAEEGSLARVSPFVDLQIAGLIIGLWANRTFMRLRAMLLQVLGQSDARRVRYTTKAALVAVHIVVFRLHMPNQLEQFLVFHSALFALHGDGFGIAFC